MPGQDGHAEALLQGGGGLSSNGLWPWSWFVQRQVCALTFHQCPLQRLQTDACFAHRRYYFLHAAKERRL